MVGPTPGMHEHAAPLNLMGIITASSFDAHARSVNALTEEVAHIRFSVRPGGYPPMATQDRVGKEPHV